MIRISEVFASIQGEGYRIGTPSVFCRTRGCVLQCKDCDTQYAQSLEDGELLEVAPLATRILELAAENGCTDFILTGGEPFLQPAEDVSALLSELATQLYITVETSGWLYDSAYFTEWLAHIDLLTISPKLESFSGSLPFSQLAYAANVHQLCAIFHKECEVVLKFVVSSKDDFWHVDEWLKALDTINITAVILQPNSRNHWCTPPPSTSLSGGLRWHLTSLQQLIESAMKHESLKWHVERGIQFRFLPQLHRLLYGAQRKC